MEQTYKTKHVIGTSIQHLACHWNKHTKLSMSLEQTLEQTYQTCHWNRHTTLSMSLEQAYKTKHVIGTNIQQHVSTVIGTNIQLSMSLEQTYNICMSLTKAYNTKHVIGTNIQH